MMATFALLGYRAYFANLPGVAKLGGVVALVAPGYLMLKEWVCAGFVFTSIAAVVSHAASSNARNAPGPLVVLVLPAVSYCIGAVQQVDV